MRLEICTDHEEAVVVYPYDGHGRSRDRCPVCKELEELRGEVKELRACLEECEGERNEARAELDALIAEHT